MSWITTEVAKALGEEPSPDTKPMVAAIRDLRDELSVLSVKSHGHGSRELAMVLTKLDEARLWATEYGLGNNTLLLVDKREYARNLEATKDLEPRTDKTEVTELEEASADV